MIEMTLSSRHRIRNSSPGGLRPSTLPSVTEAPHNTDFHTWMGKKHFCFFKTAETGNRTPNSGVKGSGANHYPRAPAPGYCTKMFRSVVAPIVDYSFIQICHVIHNATGEVKGLRHYYDYYAHHCRD